MENQKGGPKNFCFLNVNSDRRLKNPLYSCWTSKYDSNIRVKYLSEYCWKKLTEKTVVFLVEVDDEMFLNLSHLLKCKGDIFTIFNVPYNQSDLSFKFVVLIPKEFEINEIFHVPLTKSGLFIFDKLRPTTDAEKKADTYYMEETLGELFEKSFLHLRIENVHLIGTHLGMGFASKLLQSKKLMDYVNQNILNTYPIIVGGDFNAFGPNGFIFSEQMNVFLQNDFVNNISFDTDTFYPYQYDIRFLIRNEKDLTEYDSFLKTQIAVNPNIAKDFFDFCKKVELKEKTKTALDNIFTKNCKVTCVQISPECCKSDHSSIQINIK